MDIPLGVTLGLGLLFLVTAFATVFLMFHLWGYPFDKATRTSSAPPSLMRLHRMLGWLYFLLYIVMMCEMVPRLWEYQVELPPRTVVHMILGITIGVILLVKISILRFFRHLEEWMPVLGVTLLACTILLSGLSVPFALREYSLARSAVGGGVYSLENRQRVAKLLPQAEMPAEAPIDGLSSVEALRAGRDVLSGKCVVCHDLKTILVQPRTPSGWWKTVERMANKPSFSDPLSEDEQYRVTAYLIAISGDLQRSVRERKLEEDKRKAAVAEVKLEVKETATEANAGAGDGDLPPFDEALAARTFETLCSQCHELKEVENKPPKTSEEVKNLIIRMLQENGMEAKKEELDLVYLHMVKVFAGGKLDPPKAAPKPEPRPEPTPADVAPADKPEDARPEDAAPADKPADKPKPAKAKDDGPKIDGKPLYDKHCKVCHAPDGKGTEGMKKNNIPDFTDKGWQAGHSKAKVAAAIADGVAGTKMKAFKDKLGADEVAAVAAYVKKLK
jgi:mono/diheme cytochrome c family protein